MKKWTWNEEFAENIKKDNSDIFMEIMKRAAVKCINDGEFFEVDSEDNPGFQFSNDALQYMNAIGVEACIIKDMLSSGYVDYIEDERLGNNR